MYTLDLGFNNKEVYKGCHVVEFEPKRYRLVTPIDSAIVLVSANLLELLKTIPEQERDRLVITGAVPPQILLTAQSVMSPFFGQFEFLDGRSGKSTSIPQPPEDFESDPE